MHSSFAEGWDKASMVLSNFMGSFVGDRCGRVSDAIQTLQDDVNQFEGYSTGTGQLSGDVAEFWHADTHNINAALRGSDFKVYVDRSHDFASADLTSNWGDKFGLKYLRDANSSAKAQSISYFQRFKEYQYTSGQPDLTFQEYLSLKGIPEGDIMNDPIYSGQIRIIPSDQYEDAVAFLKYKIAKESITRPEQVARYQDTLDNLQKTVKDPDGITSTELSKGASVQYAQEGESGDFHAYDADFTPADLIGFKDIVGQGVKAGTTAATITFVMQIAPGVIRIISDMIKNGEVDERRFKEVGLNALPASSESFLRGFVAGSITMAYESGKLGNLLKGINPEMVPGVIGALTVVAMSTIKDSIKCVRGEISGQELATNILRNLFVSGCAIGMGALLQSALPALPFAYFMGNAVGTLVGSFVFSGIDNLFVSICVDNGYSFFGLVRQDYEMPEEILKELGIDWSEVQETYFDEYEMDEMEIEEMNLDENEGDYVKMIRRGVFKVHHIGYLYA